MSDSSAQYIHLVQHLIEVCMLFYMSKEECIEALSKHANVLPLITSTVWKELEKENKEFFEAYYERNKSNKTSEKKQKECESAAAAAADEMNNNPPANISNE